MWFEPYNDHPDGEVGDRWQCGQCDAIWQIVKSRKHGTEWRRLA